jgi:hypothetical protein
MKNIVRISLTIILALVLATLSNCRDKGHHPKTGTGTATGTGTGTSTATFNLSVDSLEITGEVDDVEVEEVDVDGEKWAVTDKKFTGTADTTGKDKIEIQAKDKAGNTGKKTIEIK